jgi:hypothetical protein
MEYHDSALSILQTVTNVHLQKDRIMSSPVYGSLIVRTHSDKTTDWFVAVSIYQLLSLADRGIDST